jgi:membrane-associated protein
MHTMSGLLDPSGLLKGAGPWALALMAAIIFVETGLLFPFLPGDSLVFAAGLLAGTSGAPLWLVVVVVAVAAIVGDSVGYAIGRRFGRGLFKDDARVFKTRYLERAEEFFARYGGAALVLARFVPIVRTFVPPAVGAARMPYGRFFFWNAIGGIGWAALFGVAGFYLGSIPVVADNVEFIAVGIVVLSVVPIAIGLLRERARRRRAVAAENGNDTSDR